MPQPCWMKSPSWLWDTTVHRSGSGAEVSQYRSMTSAVALQPSSAPDCGQSGYGHSARSRAVRIDVGVRRRTVSTPLSSWSAGVATQMWLSIEPAP